MIATSETTPIVIHMFLDGPIVTQIGLSFDKGERCPIEGANALPQDWQNLALSGLRYPHFTQYRIESPDSNR